jgi:hypothetical protein
MVVIASQQPEVHPPVWHVLVDKVVSLAGAYGKQKKCPAQVQPSVVAHRSAIQVNQQHVTS